MEDQKSTLWPHVLRWGMIVGAISVAWTCLLYAVNYALMVQLKFLFFSLLIYFGVTIYGGLDYRKSLGGYLSYGKAFIHGFLVLAVSALIATLFSIILYTVIDPELPQKLTDASIENTRGIMESVGAPEDSIDEALDKARENAQEQFSIIGSLKGYLSILFFSAIMALISAIFVRKNQPVDL